MKRPNVLVTRALRATAIICVVGSASSVALAQASPPAPPQIKVSWREIVKLVDHHPRLAIGKHTVAEAQASVKTASAVPNPSLAVQGGYARGRDGPASKMEWSIALSIPLSWLARRGTRLDAANARAKAADAQAQVLRRDVLLRLRALFWRLVYEQERVATLEELSRQTSKLANTVKRRVEKGEVRPVEATRVEVEAERIIGELELARSTATTRAAQLGTWLGIGFGRHLVATGDLSALPTAVTAKKARESARSTHPAVLAAAAQVAASQAEVVVARRARVPSFALGAFTAHELDSRAYGLGLTIDLSLWNWNTGGIARAKARLGTRKARLHMRRIELDTAAIEAQANCRAGIALARRYKDRLLPRAKHAAHTTERTYQLGETTLLEVLDARRTLLQTRRQVLDALVRAQTACSRLRMLIGEELS